MDTKIAKLTGTPEMDEALERMVQATNDGFTGGKVTKHALVSWIVPNFEKEYFQECLERIRKDHFDPLLHFESVVKRAKEARRAGASSDEIAAILNAGTPGLPPSRLASPRRTKAAESSKPAQLDIYNIDIVTPGKNGSGKAGKNQETLGTDSG